MASKNGGTETPDSKALRAALRRYVRARGAEHLRDPNVTSIGVGRKNLDGDICLVVTVGQKAEASVLESIGTEEIPKTIDVEGFTVQTDVVERSYEPSHRVVEEVGPSPLKTRLDPVMPGASVSHYDGTAGTIGMIVFDGETGAPCLLSNWHVLHRNGGEIGDMTVQPGPHDDNNTSGNSCGYLLRSHLGAAGDGALTRLQGRQFERNIFGLDVCPAKLADVELDDAVVKTGRTTQTTYGIVRRTDVMAKIDYGHPTGEREIGGFEIAPDPNRPANNNEISMGGDSGAAWMIANGEKATDIFAGLHFAGEGSANPDEHALACYPRSVQSKLNFTLEPPEAVRFDEDDAESLGARAGYDAQFLGLEAPMPVLTHGQKIDAVNFGRAQVIPYTHFSVCLSAKRKLARFVAWNIDGARKVTLGDHSFRKDDRVDLALQLGDEVYDDNPLDKGHLARRADLAWGPIPEAKQANKDSYFYTNCAPQHMRFNRSNIGGIWGKLENEILTTAAQDDIKVSVLAGPIFAREDPFHFGAQIPRQFWKLIAYRQGGDLKAACFILSQNDQLAAMEAFDFEPFRLHAVSVARLAEDTGLGFDAYLPGDTYTPDAPAPERVAEAPRTRGASGMREIFSMRDLGF